MYQEIVICPDIFEKIVKNFTKEAEGDLDLKSYKENLKLKKLLLDSGEKSHLFDAIKKVIDDADYLGKKNCQAILDEFLNSKRVEFKEVKERKNYFQLKSYNNALHLGIEADSKIINSNDNRMKSMELLFNEIEVIDMDEFVSPPNDSSLYNWKRDIRLIKGETIDVFHKLRYYFQDTKRLKIEDKYLRNKIFQFPNLVKLLMTCKILQELEIITNLEDKTEKDINKNMSKGEFQKELKKIKDIKINIIQSKDEMHDRQYFTDEFLIEFSSGLDFIDNHNQVQKNSVKISIAKL